MRFAERLLLLDLGILMDGLLSNVIILGHGMGKDKAEAQEHHHDSHPMPEPALACRFLALSHCNFLSVLYFDKPPFG
jgi:hypothetical protein